MEGRIGKDPWGQAFQYQVLREVDGQPIKVLVWSAGPNKRAESLEQVLEQAIRVRADQAVQFAGDDIGFVYFKQ